MKTRFGLGRRRACARWIGGAAGAAAAAAALAMTPAFAPAATTVSWNNGSGGNWTGPNWTGGVATNPPTATDTAAFNLVATYNVSFTGNVSVGNVNVGGGSNVTFANTAAGVTFTNNGTLNVTGGSFSLAAINPVTWNNTGAVTFNAPATVSLGNDMTAPTLTIGNSALGSATITGSGSTLSVPSGVSIGNGNNGSLTLANSASATTGGALNVGFSGIGTGNLNVNTGASLTHTGAITVGATGFNSAGMTINAASVTASGGTLLINSTGLLSIQNGGTFTLNNQPINVGSGTGTQGKIIVGNGTGSPSSFTQTGAVGITLGPPNGSTATIQANTGGSFTTGTGDLMIHQSSLVDIAGGTFTLNSNAIVIGTLQRSTGGTFNWAANKTMSIQNGGHLTINGGWALPNSASITIQHASSTITQSGLGALTISNGSQLTIATGATVTTAREVIADGSAGTLTQTAGSNSIGTGGIPGNFGLVLANTSGGTGSYNLSGGDLTVTQDFAGVPAEIIGGGGTGNFAQTGGSHTINGANANLVLGYAANAVGNYSITNGYVTCGLLQIGYGGAGTMTLNNGSTALSDTSIDLGRFNGVTGTLNINGGGGFAGAPAMYVGGNSASAGGTGVVNINGGDAQITGETRIWNTTGTAINLSAGALTTGSLNTSGNPTRLNWTGGMLHITGAAPFDSRSAADNLVLNAGMALNVANTTNIPFGYSLALQGGSFITGSLSGGGDLSSDLSSILTGGDNTSTMFFGTITGAGALAKNGTGTLSLRSTRIDNLTINDGSIEILPSQGGPLGTSRCYFLHLNNNAKLDLTDGKLIAQGEPVGTATGGVYTGVSGKIQSGRNGGNWSGPGIVTSFASGNPTGLGVATASQVRSIAATATAAWGGQTVTGSDTLVMYTYAGDATLDGKINVDDYGRIDSSAPLGIAGWYNGDFNYDGKINIDDYGIIDFNIGIQGAPYPTGAGAAASGLSAVPEPISLPLLAACGVASLRRRRRRDRPRRARIQT